MLPTTVPQTRPGSLRRSGPSGGLRRGPRVPGPGTASAPRARGGVRKEDGVAPVSGPHKGRRDWERPGSRPRAPRRWGAREEPPSAKVPPQPGRGPGEEAGRAVPPRPRPPLAAHLPAARPRRGPRQAPAAASPGCCLELVPRQAVLGGERQGGGEGRKEGRRERRKGRREGRGGVAAEEAGAAGPGGVRRKGEPNLTRPPRAQTLKSRSGARSPAGSDGGGACARPPAPARLPVGPSPARGRDHKFQRALRRRRRRCSQSTPAAQRVGARSGWGLLVPPKALGAAGSCSSAGRWVGAALEKQGGAFIFPRRVLSSGFSLSPSAPSRFLLFHHPSIPPFVNVY